MTLRRALGAFALLTLLGVGLTACGGGDDEADDTTTTTAEETTTTAEEFDPDAGGDGTEEEPNAGDDEGEENSEEQGTFADDVTEQVTGQISVPTADPYSGYTLVFNDDGSVEASFPDEWEYIGTPDETLFPGSPLLLGSTDTAAYAGSWAESGAEVRLVATDITDTEAAVEEVATVYADQCDNLPVEELDLEDDYYYGHAIVGLDCGETETDYVTIAADRDGAGNGLVLVGVQIANTADLGALEEVLGTFAITQPG